MIETKVRESLSPLPSGEIGISPQRGHIHTIGLPHESQHALILANGGAQLMNSHHYDDRHRNPESNKIVGANEEAMNAFMLGFSRPGDIFAFSTTEPEVVNATLGQLGKTYAQVGIDVTTRFEHADDIDCINPNRNGVIPNVMSPEIMAKFGSENVGERNRAAYRKDVTQAVWADADVPTPPTSYLTADTRHDALSQLAQFADYEELVVNIIDGSGGFGLEFVKREDALYAIEHILAQFPGEKIQIQGRLPLAASPGVIFHIGEEDVTFLSGAEQRFCGPGQFGGNVWTADMEDDFDGRFPQFGKTVYDAANALREFGVRGQINMDALLVNEDVAERYDVPPVLMREANIRPGGSSILLRLRQAQLNAQTPSSILTNTSVYVPPETFFDLSVFTDANRETNMKTVPYNYYAGTGRLSVAFLGNSAVTISDLEAYEKDTLRRLHTR